AARARRLLPGLAGLLVGVGAAALIFAPDAVASLRRQLIPSAAYYLNWSSIYTHTSYFQQTGRPPLLLHLWSLAVEEQFYLIWPVVVLLVLRRHKGKRGRRMLRTVALTGALLSTAWMAVLAARHGFPVPNDPSRAYYGTDTHAMGLMLGSALACIWPLGALPRLVRYERNVLDVVGGAAICWLLWIFHSASEFSYWLYRGGFLLYSAAAVVAVAVIAHPECRLGRVMGVQPIRWVGERSYGIYLWHWPIFMLTRPNLDIGITGTANLILRLGLTAIAAELSWRFLEQPIRHGALGRLLAACRALGQRQAAASQRNLARTSVSFGVAAVLVLSFLAVDRHSSSASEASIDTAPPPVTAPPSAVSSSAPKPTPSPDGTLARNVVPTKAPTVAPSTRPAARTTTQAPTAPHTTAPGRKVTSSVTAWGDSVMLGARYGLAFDIPGVLVDAVVGRQAGALPSGLAQLRKDGELGREVVIHVGDNGLFLRSTLDNALTSLADRQRVVLVTVRVPRRWQDPVNSLLKSVAAGHKNVVIADWYAASAGHPEYFVRDGVHLTSPGIAAFAALIAHALA
ncbi:MAG TPA: acyltransferase family protein, partial [Frankiaceae bacterium]|nr:acyltransferase family protein [Frankiaceae bacterium]